MMTEQRVAIRREAAPIVRSTDAVAGECLLLSTLPAGGDMAAPCHGARPGVAA
jgi:hypothetical protein